MGPRPTTAVVDEHGQASPLAAMAQLRLRIRQIQDYLGHANVETTMIYTHVVKEFRTPARSPLDIIHSHTIGKG